MLRPKSWALSCLVASRQSWSNKKRAFEDVNAHRRKAMRVVAGHRLGNRRFFLESDDAFFVVDLHHAEFFRFVDAHFQRGDRQVGVVRLMKIDHLAVVHLVDVVTSKNDDMLGTLLFERVDVLVHGRRQCLGTTARRSAVAAARRR